ncbi:ABC transporter substrate-binding protein [Acidocella facilis]|uniref:ABC transporter substrate-binding protein n=1 Tax=Acidocella facilis TaxID=525 RepID=UPI001F1866AA|nr:ABC transporter substrate-binding protein [Acidocella facilis]
MSPLPRRALLGTGLALALPALGRAASTAQKPPAPTPPKARFGAALPLTGAEALQGDEALRGILLAIADVNAAGGVAGQPVAFTSADMSTQASAATAVNGLLTQSHANLLLGSGSSALSYPATAAAELAQTPFIELTAPADGIMTRGFKFLLRTAPTTSMIGGLAAATVQARFAKRKLGLLFNTGATDGAIAAATLTALGKAGQSVALSAGYPTDAAGLYEQVGRMMRAKVEVLLHAAGPDDTLALFQAMRNLDWRPDALLGCGNGYGLRDTQVALGGALNGTFVIAAPFFPGPAQAVAKAYETRFAVPPRSAESCTAYVGAKLTFDTLNAAGGDPAKLLAALRQLKLAPGALANGFGAQFDVSGQNIASFVTLQIWKDGALVPV